ncbi:MAG TPA: WbqC family protein [Bacteroidales bacterium]|nr:WbqC family protein [Bacteroidales bacterium]
MLLSYAYFPPVSYVSLILKAGSVTIEDKETFVKQTYRNRFRIYSANGPLSLSVPVHEGSFRKVPVNRVRIDYTKRWQPVHLGAIESSYRSAPYFEYYIDTVRSIYDQKTEFLASLDLATLQIVMDALKINVPVNLTGEYVPEGPDEDFRYLISPKKTGISENSIFEPYPQPFSGRYGFIADLSILDLMFCMGPGSLGILEKTVVRT